MHAVLLPFIGSRRASENHLLLVTHGPTLTDSVRRNETQEGFGGGIPAPTKATQLKKFTTEAACHASSCGNAVNKTAATPPQARQTCQEWKFVVNIVVNNRQKGFGEFWVLVDPHSGAREGPKRCYHCSQLLFLKAARGCCRRW